MSDPQFSLDCTSSHLEKVVIQRFRDLNPHLPANCRIFREPWGASTVLCLDLAPCIEHLDRIFEQSPHLTLTLQTLGLSQALVFRMGTKLLGWRDIASKHG